MSLQILNGKQMKHFILLGASGYLGQHLIQGMLAFGVLNTPKELGNCIREQAFLEIPSWAKPIVSYIEDSDELSLFDLNFSEETKARATQVGAQCFQGDLRDEASLEAMFKHIKEKHPTAELYVIHTASKISIASPWYVQEELYQINVLGTKNVLQLCERYGVKRLLYVSSVHALPEEAQGVVQAETKSFPLEKIHGAYAQSKALATQEVFAFFNPARTAQACVSRARTDQVCTNQTLAEQTKTEIVIVHPSGIFGGGQAQNSSLHQVFYDYLAGKLSVAVQGGYDFVDVEDVSFGIWAALFLGQPNENYILSGHYATIKDCLAHLEKTYQLPKIKAFLPPKPLTPFAYIAEFLAYIFGKKNFFTPYALYTLTSNALFSYEKAKQDFGYSPRPLQKSLESLAKAYDKFPKS